MQNVLNLCVHPYRINLRESLVKRQRTYFFQASSPNERIPKVSVDRMLILTKLQSPGQATIPRQLIDSVIVFEVQHTAISARFQIIYTNSRQLYPLLY